MANITWDGNNATWDSEQATWSPIFAPENLTATPVSTSQIDLAWDALDGATGYDIERNGVVIAQDVATNSYEDMGLSPDTLYTYRVKAVL